MGRCTHRYLSTKWQSGMTSIRMVSLDRSISDNHRGRDRLPVHLICKHFPPFAFMRIMASYSRKPLCLVKVARALEELPSNQNYGVILAQASLSGCSGIRTWRASFRSSRALVMMEESSRPPQFASCQSL